MKYFLRLVTLSCLLGAFLPVIHAQDMGAIRDRMVERLGTLDSLKASGAIGENNQGFVEVRENKANTASVVAAENADREVVYAMIAKKNGVTAAQVGQARARQIAAGTTAPGVWLQNPNGEWYQK